jgi:hypothetical protein
MSNPQEDAPESASHNGVPPGLLANPAHAIGAAVADALAQVLPMALANVLSQVPIQAVTPQHMCATCLIQRVSWENAHRTDMKAAMDAAAHAAGVEPGSPEAARIDFGPFLPEPLRPGAANAIPQVGQAITAVQGTEVCPMHIPGVQAGRQPLLVAQGAISPAMLG